MITEKPAKDFTPKSTSKKKTNDYNFMVYCFEGSYQFWANTEDKKDFDSLTDAKKYLKSKLEGVISHRKSYGKEGAVKELWGEIINTETGERKSYRLDDLKGDKLLKDFTPKSRGMKKAGYTGEIKKGDVFLWQDPGPNPDPESETEIRGVDKERGQVSYMESYASIAKGMDIDRFRKGIIKKVSGKTEASGANEVEECRKILNNAGYATKKKLSKDGKKAMKVKEPRPERTIIKDKVGDTFKTIMKDVSGSKEKDEKYGAMQKKLSELQDLFTKLFSRLNNLAEDNKIEDADKIIALLKKIVD